MAAAHLLAPPVNLPAAPDWAPGCSGKLSCSRGEAAQTRARRAGGVVYQCAACGGWHTSSFSRPTLGNRTTAAKTAARLALSTSSKGNKR